jgi:K+-transporting ATPase ATPase A chain
MHDSLTPMGGFVPLAQMMLNRVRRRRRGLYQPDPVRPADGVPGGHDDRPQPEFLGKKIEAREMKLMLAVLAPRQHPGLHRPGRAVARHHGQSQQPRPPRLQRGALRLHLGTANNGSAFAGLNANTPFFNTTIGLAMLIGRFFTCCRCWPWPAPWR